MAAYTNNPIHSTSIHIPLEELQQRINEIKTDKILIPYCGGEYKSSIALSMIKNLRLDLKVQK
jgi:aminopeptidase-like protein